MQKVIYKTYFFHDGGISLRQKKYSLGELLVKEGEITEQQLEEALMFKEENKLKLGQALLELGFVNEELLLTMLSKQLRIPIKRKNDIQVNPVAIEMFPVDLVKEHFAFPFDKNEEEGTVSFLVKDPLNLLLEDQVYHKTNMRVEFFLGLEKDIDSLIYEQYENKKVMEDLEGLEHGDKDDELFDMNVNDENSPIVKMVNNIFKKASIEGASDIHIAPTEKNIEVRYRIDGILHMAHELPKKAHSALTSRIKTMSDMDITEKRKPQDGRIQITLDGHSIDMRVNTLPTVYGEKVTIRLLDKGSLLLDIKELGFLDSVQQSFESLIRFPVGVILITGPTGSGKTSTLYTAINELNDVSRNVITIEDPVEYKIHGIVQVQTNEKAGLTFASGLRSILRQDPDIVLVGEIRDQETASIAVKAANTGHLVLSTLHTNDAVSTITRLIDMGVAPYLVASTVVGIVNQRLVRKICDNCKVKYKSENDASDRAYFQISPHQDLYLYEGQGCEKCKGTGFKGRVPIQELLVMDNDIKKMISHQASEREIYEMAIDKGMIPMIQDGLEKAMLGLTTLDEVKRFVSTS